MGTLVLSAPNATSQEKKAGPGSIWYLALVDEVRGKGLVPSQPRQGSNL